MDTHAEGEPDPNAYPYVHPVRGALLSDLGRFAEARASLEAALAVARNAAERRQIARQLSRLPREL